MSTDDLRTIAIEGTDGSVADVVVARADGASHGVVVLPALGIPETYYAPLLVALRARGVSAAVLGAPTFRDARAKRPPVYGYAELAIDFVPRAIAALDVPASGTFLVGHSLGGAVAGIHAGRVKDVAGIALVAAGTPFHEAYDGAVRVRTLFGTQLIGAIASVLGFFPGDRLGFGGRMSGKLAKEWSAFARTGRLTVTHPSGIDAERTLSEVRCPVLAVVLPGDELAPARAVEHLVGKLGTADHTVRRYVAPAGHKKVDHNRWPRDPEPFADIFVAFMASVTGAGSDARSVGSATALPNLAA